MSKEATTVKARRHPASGSAAGRPKGKTAAAAPSPPAPGRVTKARREVVSPGTTESRTSGDTRGVHLTGATGALVPTTKTKAKTLRLEPQYENALGFLKAVLGASVNKMVNDAVGQYIQRETARVEVNLGDLLAQVKAYRKADPDFSHAHARVVEAEVRAAGNDPADGTPYREAPATTRRRSHA